MIIPHSPSVLAALSPVERDHEQTRRIAWSAPAGCRTTIHVEHWGRVMVARAAMETARMETTQQNGSNND